MNYVVANLRGIARESIAEGHVSRAANLNSCANHVQWMEERIASQGRYIEKLRAKERPPSVPHSMPEIGTPTGDALAQSYEQTNYGGD